MAFCLVGELRTFSVPWVGAAWRKYFAERWNPDIFFFYHTDYNEALMASANRQGAVSCDAGAGDAG